MLTQENHLQLTDEFALGKVPFSYCMFQMHILAISCNVVEGYFKLFYAIFISINKSAIWFCIQLECIALISPVSTC